MKQSVLGILFLATITYAQTTARPEVQATVCQGWGANLQPEGATDTFFADNATVRLVLKSKES